VITPTHTQIVQSNPELEVKTDAKIVGFTARPVLLDGDESCPNRCDPLGVHSAARPSHNRHIRAAPIQSRTSVFLLHLRHKDTSTSTKVATEAGRGTAHLGYLNQILVSKPAQNSLPPHTGSCSTVVLEEPFARRFATVFWGTYWKNPTWGDDPEAQIVALFVAGFTAATGGLSIVNKYLRPST
jgi:hypothetical protein